MCSVRHRDAILIALVLVVVAGCRDDPDEFDRAALVPRTAEETEAFRRMRASVVRAEALLKGSALPERVRAELRERTEAAWHALREYDELRVQGSERSIVLAGIRTSSIAIVADDATVIGSADDLLLIPLALAALATYMLTDAEATQDELAAAWANTARRFQELAVTVEDTIALTAAGRVPDTGIMEEVFALLAEMGLPSSEENRCKALKILWNRARKAGNNKRKSRIVTTEKALDCRRSRHSRE